MLCALLASLFVVVFGVQAFWDHDRSQVAISSLPPPAYSYHSPLPEPRPSPGKAQHVVIISVDGLRPDAIGQARAPVLMGLMERGTTAIHAETIRPSITLPSHTAMLTGLDFKRHGVVWNNYRPGHILQPTVFSTAVESGLSTAMLFAKDKFHFIANPDQVHWIFGPEIPKVIPKLEDVTKPDFKENTGPDPKAVTPPSPAPVLNSAAKPVSKDSAATPSTQPRPPPPATKPSTSADGLARAFEEEWPRHHYQLTFVHFGETDAAGHGKGWMTRPYLDALLKVDQAVGKILAALDAAGVLEKTAIIVTADHGGIGKQHYYRAQPDMPENVTIPWICVGPGVRKGLVINRLVRTMDTAPTALAFLGLAAPPGIDGQAVREVFENEER